MMFPKKGKSTSGQNLKKKLDIVFSRFIRARDSNGEYFTCITCQKVKGIDQMDAGHFMSRRYLSTRYDERNVNGQCKSCNRFNAGNQYIHGKNIDHKYGQGTAESLFLLAHTQSKLPNLWYETMIIEYKKKLDQLGAMQNNRNCPCCQQMSGELRLKMLGITDSCPRCGRKFIN